MAYADEVLADRPRGYWKLNEASGLPQDSSGNGLHMTSVTGTPDYEQPGPFGNKAIRYLANEDHAYSTVVSSVTNNFSIELAFRLDAVSSNDSAMIYNGNGGANGWGIVIDTNRTFQYLAGGVAYGANSATALTLGTWYHIVVVRDAGTWKYYVNGAVDTANAGTTAPGTPSGTFDSHPTSGNDGVYSQIAVYETALSATRVLAHYQALTTVLTRLQFVFSGRGAA